MLDLYWPKAKDVNACIKNEAETADVAVLLAVHQPSPLTTRDVGSGAQTVVSEANLLDAFLTDNVPGGALLFPITGASGAGKSHMIRWLDAQLQRSPKRDSLHIIRIPKSASLRTVVEKILDPLKDNPLYEKVRAEMNRAVAEVDVSTAVITFRAHLENALGEIRAALEAENRERPDRANLVKIGHARDLPRLFSDAALHQHFVDKVLSRIISRSLRGRPETEDEGEDETQFTAEDLRLPPEVDLSQAAHAVRTYYQLNLASADPAKVKVAVDILNDAIDPAIGGVFQLQQSTGGMTLQDIILAVRETLLDEGKDLVLLVEDFAALSGIQDVLLKVCIQEGEYEGRKVRATMRTAIALTDGVLSFRDTIYTRAQKEWIVGGRDMADDEIRDAAIELVGAYLNAARWGEEDLKRLFKAEQGAATSDWLPIWRDDDDDKTQAQLKAFGQSKAGSPLFPFNRQAIFTLADAHLIKNQVLVLNPRKIINEILRSTLLLRTLFEANAFPSADQRAITPNHWLAGWISRTHQTDVTARRLGALLAVWGGNPSNEDGLSRLPPGLFEAFNLPTPQALAQITFVEPEADLRDPEAEDGDSGTKKRDLLTPALSADPWALEWQAKLDAWAGGGPLVQTDAAQIRTALGAMLDNAMDWPRLRLKRQTIRPNAISIPNARGNPPRRGLEVCASHEDAEGRVRAGLLGALRYYKNGQRWNYRGADDDYVASSALVDHLIDQLTPLLLEDADRQIRTIARGLLTQARITGMAPPLKAGAVSGTLAGLFEPLPAQTAQAFDTGWEGLRTAAWSNISGQPARKALQIELLNLMSSFQGTGAVVYALDSVRLLDSLARPVDGEGASDDLPAEISSYLRQFGDSRVRPQLQSLIGKLAAFRSDLEGYLDEGFDKSAFVKDLQDVVRLLLTTGTWPDRLDLTARDYERRLAAFQAAPIVELANKAKIVDQAGEDQLSHVLNALGSLDLSNIHRTVDFLTTTERLINAAQESVDRSLADKAQADPVRIADEIETLLNDLIRPPSTEGEGAEA